MRYPGVDEKGPCDYEEDELAKILANPWWWIWEIDVGKHRSDQEQSEDRKRGENARDNESLPSHI
jgi:hypothetical protein